MNDSIFINKMYDVVKLSEKYHSARFSKFLDSREQAVLKSEIPNASLFGGYDEAERCIFGVFPDWLDEDDRVYPISVIKFIHKFDKELTHRHFLGTILSLGIERDKIGDILVGEKNTFVFVSDDIAEFVKTNITKVSGCGVKTEIIPICEVTIPEKKFQMVSSVCASMRIDAVISGLTGMSRNESKNLIISGRVQIDHFEITKTDFILKENDLISVKGFGRAEIYEIGNKTRSDRIHITFKKYI